MDLLSLHEAFLRAIFDAPDDDTPRLVYADFLEETGDEHRAELIRVQCERARLAEDADPARRRALEERNGRLKQIVVPWDRMKTGGGVMINRGLWHEGIARGLAVTPDDLGDPAKFREWVVHVTPGWYGEPKLYVPAGPLLSEHIDILYHLPFVRQVVEWNFGGRVEEIAVADETDAGEGLPRLIDFRVSPAVTPGAVDGLVRNRAARRITALDLRNNNLDNDAARALVRSPYLDNLKRLDLLQGNRLRGKVWQQVIERFGEDVVG